MDYSFFEGVYSLYGVHSIISAILLCLIRLILKKVFKKKINGVVRSYIEILFSLAFELIFTINYFGSINDFSLKSISSALISYSTSLVLYSLISRIFSGKSVKQNYRALIIETLIEDYVFENKKTSVANKITSILSTENIDRELLYKVIKENQVRPFSTHELTALVDIIINSTKDIK